MNYGGIEEVFTSPDAAAFGVLPVPYDLTSTYQAGSRRGPSAILEASTHMELYDEELGVETFRAGIYTASALEPEAGGPAEMVAAVRRGVDDLLDRRLIPVILGGEHSISLGAVQAIRDRYPGLSVLQLDAHADLRDSYQGSPYSHACVARRIRELCPLVQAGIRSMSVEEAAFIKEEDVVSYSALAILRDPDWCEKICARLQGDVYVTIDLDVLDPSVMPSTGTPEPEGLSWRNVLQVIERVSRLCRVRGFDVVELAPIPGIVAPDFLAAKLVYRIMGYIFRGR